MFKNLTTAQLEVVRDGLAFVKIEEVRRTDQSGTALQHTEEGATWRVANNMWTSAVVELDNRRTKSK